MTDNTISWDSVRADFLADPAVKAAYDALEAQYHTASRLIALRAATGMTQREFAERVGMKQSQLARIESGKQIPKLETLAKLAAAAGYAAVEVHFIPPQGKRSRKIKPLRIAVADIDDAKSSKQVVSPVTAFLESDDPRASKVRERLGGRSLSDLAAELEKCRSLPEESDRIFAAKNSLACGVIGGGNNRDSSDDSNDELELLYLAESLLEKLDEIWSLSD